MCRIDISDVDLIDCSEKIQGESVKAILSLLVVLTALMITVIATAGSRSGIITMEFDLSAHKNGEEARLWVPYPVSDADQLVSDVKVEGDFAEAAVYTDRVFQTPMLFVRWDADSNSRNLTLSLAVERHEVIRRDLAGKEAAWDPADYALYLMPTSLAPDTRPVKELADRITAGRSSVRDKAKAIYDWVCESMHRDPETQGCGKGDVCSLLDKRGGKCADIHSVFVALARASGIPCREVFGIRLGKKDGEDITGAHHCWAEFYVPGYGWVPVDPADVLKLRLTEKADLNDPRVVQAREYYWGGIDPYRVKLSVGRDLTLTPAQKGEPVNYLMYPFAQVGGETLDWLDSKTFAYTITFRAR
jgi:transglutaminase-like putative cysteine protease